MSADAVAPARAGDVVRGWFAALSELRMDDVAELMDPAGEYWVLRGRRTVTNSTFLAVYADLVGRRFVDGIRFVPGTAVGDERSLAVRADAVGALPDGAAFAGTYAFFFELADGRITKVWEFGDTQQAAELFGG